MERRSFLKALGASSVVLGANGVIASDKMPQMPKNSTILVDKFSKSFAKGDLVEVDFMNSYAKSSQILKDCLKANKQVVGVLSNANFVLISEFLPENSSVKKPSIDNNLVYFSL